MAVSIVQIFLINESGEIIIQKRAKHKKHNAGLLDKTVWGHIQYGDPVDYTVMVETVEELQCPSIVVKEDEDFGQRLGLLRNYIDTIAVVSHIDTKIEVLKNIYREDGEIDIAKKNYLFMWVYGGRLKNVDKEAMWLLYYELDDLLEEMKQYPNMFTHDLEFFVHTYEDDIRSFISLVKRVLSEE